MWCVVVCCAVRWRRSPSSSSFACFYLSFVVEAAARGRRWWWRKCESVHTNGFGFNCLRLFYLALRVFESVGGREEEDVEGRSVAPACNALGFSCGWGRGEGKKRNKQGSCPRSWKEGKRCRVACGGGMCGGPQNALRRTSKSPRDVGLAQPTAGRPLPGRVGDHRNPKKVGGGHDHPAHTTPCAPHKKARHASTQGVRSKELWWDSPRCLLARPNAANGCASSPGRCGLCCAMRCLFKPTNERILGGAREIL